MQNQRINNKYREYISMSYIISIMLLNIVLLKLLFSHQIDKIYLPMAILLIMLFTLLLSNNILKKDFNLKPLFKDYLYLNMYIALINLTIYYNITYDKDFIKVFYLLPIILFSANYGKKHGIYATICVSFSLLLINYMNGNYYVIDLDIVLMIMLFWMAWLIGGFVDIERKIRDDLIKTTIELKEANSELEKTQELFKANFEESNVGMFINNLDGRIIKVNNSFADMLGYKKDYLIGKKINDLEVKYDRKSRISKTINNELELLEVNNQFYSNKGETIWVNQNTTVVYNKNKKPQYYLNHVQNLTEATIIKEKLLLQKEELEYSKVKSKFFANLSHELKTPINLIFSALQIMKAKEREKRKGNNKYLKIINQNCLRLLRLVNNIIDLTKLDVNSYEIHLNNYDIVNIISKIISSTREYVDSKQKSIHFDTSVEKLIMACDPFSIERILLNLISNAVKFSNKGDIITISLSKKNNNLIIKVADTGIGIKPDKLAIIFDYFRQVDDSFSRRSEGSGIGLSLVKSLVELHNGEIWVESKYGAGTIFYISLPIKVLENTDEKDNYQTSNYLDKVSLEFSDIYE